MWGHGDLVTVASYTDAIQAHLARGRLEAEGIRAEVADEHYVSADWLMSNAVGGVKVRVPERMAERARRILQEIEAGDFALPETLPETMPASPPASPPDPARCPRCGSDAVEASEASWRFAVLGLHFLQLPLPFTRFSHRCRHCGMRWR